MLINANEGTWTELTSAFQEVKNVSIRQNGPVQQCVLSRILSTAVSIWVSVYYGKFKGDRNASPVKRMRPSPTDCNSPVQLAVGLMQPFYVVISLDDYSFLLCLKEKARYKSFKWISSRPSASLGCVCEGCRPHQMMHAGRWGLPAPLVVTMVKTLVFLNTATMPHAVHFIGWEVLPITCLAEEEEGRTDPALRHPPENFPLSTK